MLLITPFRASSDEERSKAPGNADEETRLLTARVARPTERSNDPMLSALRSSPVECHQVELIVAADTEGGRDEATVLDSALK